jgi:hypothetical protein
VSQRVIARSRRLTLSKLPRRMAWLMVKARTRVRPG